MQEQLVDLSRAREVIGNPTGTMTFRYIGYAKEGDEHKVYVQTSHFKHRLTPSKVMKDLKKKDLYKGCIESVTRVGKFPHAPMFVGEISHRGKRAKVCTGREFGGEVVTHISGPNMCKMLAEFGKPADVEQVSRVLSSDDLTEDGRMASYIMFFKLDMLATFAGLLYANRCNYVKVHPERKAFSVLVVSEGDLVPLHGYDDTHYTKLFVNIYKKFREVILNLGRSDELDSHAELVAGALQKHWNTDFIERIFGAMRRELRITIKNAQAGGF